MLLSSNTDPNALHTSDKSLKYAIKRDLTGAVQFTNCSDVGILSFFVANAGTAGSDKAATAAGWNFFSIPKMRIIMSSLSGVVRAKFKVNGNAKLLGTLTGTTASAVTITKTAAPRQIVSNQISPNNLTLIGTLTYGGGAGYGWQVKILTSAKRNDKLEVIK